MKKNKIKLLIFISIFGFILNPLVMLKNKNDVLAFAFSNEKNTCTAEIVMEANSKRILYSKNINNKMFIASTTKILTAITVLENTDINKEITVTNKTVGIEGSSIYLEEGEILTIKDLLYGLMLRSGNDCAETLAVACSGSIDNFVELMNEKAKEIGAKNSNFTNPHGLHDDNHYSTAYDMALISSYAIKNPDFSKIVSTKKITIPFTTRDTKRVLINKNKMLTHFDGATGIKTGYTKKAGRCLVTSAKRGNLELICVVLNCYDMWEKSSLLLNECFDKYNFTKIIDCNNIIDFIDNNHEKVGVYIKEDIYFPLTKNETNDLHYKINYTYDKKKNIKKDTNIGKIDIYLENNLIFSKKIYNIVDIKNKVKL